jgi:hypothetical protein
MSAPFHPLLSATFAATAALHYPLFVSHKLDGIRAFVVDGTVVSRRAQEQAGHRAH